MNTQSCTPQGMQDVACMAVHDLRNYLACIESYAQMLAGEAPLLTTTPAQAAARIVASSSKASALLQDLWQLAWRQEGGAPAQRGDILAVEDLVIDATATCECLFLNKGVRLEWELPQGMTLIVGDKDALGRVFANLLSNALKFTPEGGWVRVRVSREADEVRIEVRDNGIGVEQDEWRKIFEKFYQIQPHNHGSCGLGLYIAREIIRAHGGDIFVDSRGIGQGTCFWFTLPYAQAAGLRQGGE